MSVMLCTRATFEKKNCLVARIVSFNNAGLHLLTFRILGHTRPNILNLFSVTMSHMNDVIIVSSN